MGNALVYLTAIGVGGVAGWGFAPLPEPVPALTAAASRPSLTSPLTGRAGGFKLTAMTPDEIKSRVETLLAGPVRNSQELHLFMARWVEVDLEAARAWMREFPDERTRPQDPKSQPITFFFKAWAALDPKAAMDEALAVGGRKSYLAQDAVIVGFARADFSTIQEILTNMPDGRNNPRGAVMELMKQLLARDRPAALELARALPGAMGDGAVQGVASVWARTDPMAALEWSQQHPDAGTRNNAEKSILTEWARQDPLAVGPMLLQKQEGKADVFHMEAATEAVARLSEKSPEAAARFVGEFIPQDRLKANLGSLFFRMMQDEAGNPQAAAAMCAVANVLPAGTLEHTKLWRNSWMSDLKPSWERMLAEPDSPGRQFLLGEIGRKFSAQDPVRMIQDVMKLPDADMREEVLEMAFNEGLGSYGVHSQKTLEKFREAVEHMPAGVQGLGVANLAWSMSHQDPVSAVEVMRQFPDAAKSKDLIWNTAYRLTEQMDLAAAHALIGSLPTSEAQGHGLDGLVNGFYSDDSLATSEWVRSLPPGFGRDSAARALVNAAQEDDPEAAFAWAASIQDEKLRSDAAKGVVKAWGVMDRWAAQQAVEQSNLPADQKAGLLNSFTSPP